MIILILLLVVVLLFYIYLVKPIYYWKNLNVPTLSAIPIFGNSSGILFKRTGIAEWTQRIYNTHNNVRYIGAMQFMMPMLIIKDLDLIKQLTIKDFDHFTNRRPFVTEENEPIFGKNLLSLQGERWKQMRATMSPTFTGSKMRSMLFLLNACSEQLTKYFDAIISTDEIIDVELKDIFTRFSNDVIASTAFGFKCDSLTNRDNEFFLMAKEATNIGIIAILRMLSQKVAPSLTKALGIKVFSNKLCNFFNEMVSSNIKDRLEGQIVRPDMIHLLLEARKGKLKHDTSKSMEGTSGFATVEESHIGQDEQQTIADLSDDAITAQAFIFFLAGFDSQANSMCHMTYEIAINADVQKKLQEEIDQVSAKCQGNLTYEVLMRMRYMDMVVSESLRKWPGAPIFDRMCSKTYTIPAKNPDEHPITLHKGDTLIFPVYPIHRDPKYYPDPEKFDPERFSDANKDKILPCSYMPFGSGPRNCIASRFALMEMKTIIFHLLSKYDLCVTEKSQLPLRLSRRVFSMDAENGFWVGLKRRKTKQN